MKSFRPTRRTFLKAGTAATALIGLAPTVLRQAAAQDADLAAYKSAKIDWQQASGETITVAVIPASYFENLISIAPQFKALTGIDVRFEKIPPAQIRQKSVIDLTSKTGTYATHAADPMYYSLYAANKWVEPLDSYLADKSLTDADWFKFDDIIPAWRAADSIDGKLYGVPYDGEVTIQVYRKDLYEAKGLKPADDLATFVSNAAALNTPNDRIWGTALRGVAGAGQNMYIYPSIFREFGGEWFKGGKLTVNGPEAEAALAWYVDLMRKYAPTAAANWNWPDIADAFSRNGCELHRRAFFSVRHQQPREVEGDRQGRLCPLAQGPVRQARHVDLELGLSDQRRPSRKAQESDLAVHPVGRQCGNAGAHGASLRGTCETFGRQPHFDLARSGIRQADERLRRQFCRGHVDDAAKRYRCRLAAARAAMAGDRRHHGYRDPVGAFRSGYHQGGA